MALKTATQGTVPREQGPMMLFAEIKRVAFDHIGVEFAENQEVLVHQLMDELSDA